MTPDVSVLLLTRNGMTTLPAVLNALAAQQTALAVETVAIDSGSTDDTCRLLRRRVDRFVEIPAAAFNHGLTRNAGIEHCRGEFVVLLVQDAVPASSRWLDELVRPLTGQAQLAGTCARQVPRDDASPVARYYLSQWAAASPAPRVTYVAGRDVFERLTPMERFRTCVFDNVCSCVRRSVWERFPFKATRIAEDLEWARDVLLAGYGLAYVPDAVVVHSHDRPASYELGRTYLIHQRLRELFGLATIPDARSLLRAWMTTVPAHVRCEMSGSLLLARPRALCRALALAMAFPAGQYLGARSIDRGREYLRPGGF